MSFQKFERLRNAGHTLGFRLHNMDHFNERIEVVINDLFDMMIDFFFELLVLQTLR